MTTAAPDPTPWRGRPVEFVFAILGLAVAVLAAPFVVLAGSPVEGWMLGAGLFLVYWLGGIFIARFAVGLSPTHAVGVAGLSFIVRVWVIFGILLIVSLRGSREVGVAAMLVFAAAFTFDLLGRTVLHSLRQKAIQEGVEL